MLSDTSNAPSRLSSSSSSLSCLPWVRSRYASTKAFIHTNGTVVELSGIGPPPERRQPPLSNCQQIRRSTRQRRPLLLRRQRRREEEQRQWPPTPVCFGIFLLLLRFVRWEDSSFASSSSLWLSFWLSLAAAATATTTTTTMALVHQQRHGYTGIRSRPICLSWTRFRAQPHAPLCGPRIAPSHKIGSRSSSTTTGWRCCTGGHDDDDVSTTRDSIALGGNQTSTASSSTVLVSPSPRFLRRRGWVVGTPQTKDKHDDHHHHDDKDHDSHLPPQWHQNRLVRDRSTRPRRQRRRRSGPWKRTMPDVSQQLHAPPWSIQPQPSLPSLVPSTVASANHTTSSSTTRRPPKPPPAQEPPFWETTLGDIMSHGEFLVTTSTSSRAPPDKHNDGLSQHVSSSSSTSTSTSLAQLYGFHNPLDRMVLTANGNLQRLIASYYDAPVSVVVQYCTPRPPAPTGRSTTTTAAAAAAGEYHRENGQDQDHLNDDNDDDHDHDQQAKQWDRVVRLTVLNQTFCTATSVITVRDPYCVTLVDSGQVGLGQLFRYLNRLPEFSLLQAGRRIAQWSSSSSSSLSSLSNPNRPSNHSHNGSSIRQNKNSHSSSSGFWREYTLECPELSCRIREEFIPGLWELNPPP